MLDFYGITGRLRIVDADRSAGVVTAGDRSRARRARDRFDDLTERLLRDSKRQATWSALGSLWSATSSPRVSKVRAAHGDDAEHRRRPDTRTHRARCRRADPTPGSRRRRWVRRSACCRGRRWPAARARVRASRARPSPARSRSTRSGTRCSPNPRPCPTGRSSARLGVSDSASIVMPNAVLATMMWRIVISLRRAVDSAPISEPMLMIENSTVNVASSPWNVRCTSSGMHDLEVEGQRADDRHHDERDPQFRLAPGVARGRRAPAACRARRRASAGARAGFIIQRPTITAMYERPSSAERPRVAADRDQQAREGRADDPRRRHQRAVERDGVVHVVFGHHLDDERAAGRVVERDRDSRPTNAIA